MAVKERKVPTCNGGGKEFELNLTEKFQGSICCHECGTRILVKVARKDGWSEYMQIPAHTIPPELHALRMKLDKEADSARPRA